MQLLAVRAVRVSPRRMTLRVTDRVVGATAVGHRRRLRLPADRASSNVVSLRRTPAGRWQVAAVRALGD
jgi:hypothetical protein